jgi:REP element-mobilizing transposase RayT
MPEDLPHQELEPNRTTWHITWGTYGARLHGDFRPTVDRQHNQRGTPFLPRDAERELRAAATLNFPPVYLTHEQCEFIEAALPPICERGGWSMRTCSAGEDHVHLLCDILPAIHGEKVRRLAKRWMGEQLNVRWPLPKGATWWAEEGSNIATKDVSYLNNAFGYIFRQRATVAK